MTGFTKDGWILLHQATDKPAVIPDLYLDFRGDAAVLVDATPPHKEGSTGRVFVEGGGAYYPSVFSLYWKKES